jgi:hypothetical protein
VLLKNINENYLKKLGFCISNNLSRAREVWDQYMLPRPGTVAHTSNPSS